VGINNNKLFIFKAISQSSEVAKAVLFIDKLVFGMVFVLAALPFGQAVQVNTSIAILDGFELIYLLISVLLIFRVLIVGHIHHPLPFFFFNNTVILHIYTSLFFHPLIDILNQVRLYLPYFVATLMLCSGTRIKPQRILIGLTCAGLISSCSALYIQYFNPSFLQFALKSNQKVIEIALFYGRMVWSNALILFFVITALITIRTNKLIVRFLLVSSAIACFAGAFHTLNRTILIGVAIYFFAFVFSLSSIEKIVYYSLRLIPFGILAGLSAILITINNTRVRDLVSLRFFARNEGIAAAFKGAIADRVEFYKVYWESIINNFPLGQGLGTPLAAWIEKGMNVEIYITDISILSFVLPFGLLGLISFLIFILSLYKVISRSAPIYSKLKRLLIILLVISLMLSLNIDLYSRNNFVVFFTFIVSAISSDNRYHLKAQAATSAIGLDEPR